MAGLERVEAQRLDPLLAPVTGDVEAAVFGRHRVARWEVSEDVEARAKDTWTGAST